MGSLVCSGSAWEPCWEQPHALVSFLCQCRHSGPQGSVCRALLNNKDISPASRVFNQNRNSPKKWAEVLGKEAEDAEDLYSFKGLQLGDRPCISLKLPPHFCWAPGLLSLPYFLSFFFFSELRSSNSLCVSYASTMSAPWWVPVSNPCARGTAPGLGVCTPDDPCRALGLFAQCSCSAVEPGKEPLQALLCCTGPWWVNLAGKGLEVPRGPEVPSVPMGQGCGAVLQPPGMALGEAFSLFKRMVKASCWKSRGHHKSSQGLATGGRWHFSVQAFPTCL